MGHRLLYMLLLMGLPTGLWAGGGAENVLVVVNIDSDDSLAIADHYMKRRDVPPHHLVALQLPEKSREVCTLSTYRTAIEIPVANWLQANPKAPITHIVLTRDVPAMVSEVAVYKKISKAKETFRSTTHLLSLLHCAEDRLKPYGYQNPLINLNTALDRKLPPKIGNEPIPVYAGALLNAFTVDDVKAMIDRAIESERQPTKGSIYLGFSKAKDPRGCYNRDFARLSKWLESKKKTVYLIKHPGNDKELARRLLVDRKDVAYYLFGQSGWDKEFPATNTYLPGCVVDNLTSYALNPWSFKNPKKGQTTMCHFLAAGATAVHGCVSEPYTAAFHPKHRQIELFFSGYSLGESYLLAHPLMPWMNLVVGDPLLQPHVDRPKVKLDSPVRNEEKKWVVNASAGSSTASLRLYQNGHEVTRVVGSKLTFELPSWSTRTDDLSVVAVDKGPAQIQGRQSHSSFKRLKSFKMTSSESRGRLKVKFKCKGGVPVFTIIAPGHEMNGTLLRKSALSLKNPERMSTALLVLKNGPKAAPRLYRLSPAPVPPGEQ